MSAAISPFPPERIVRRADAAREPAAAAHPGAVTLCQDGGRLDFPTSDAFWEAMRRADPELTRRLADARAATTRAEALQRKAETAIATAQRCAQRLDLVHALAVMAAAVAVCVLLIGRP